MERPQGRTGCDSGDQRGRDWGGDRQGGGREAEGSVGVSFGRVVGESVGEWAEEGGSVIFLLFSSDSFSLFLSLSPSLCSVS